MLLNILNTIILKNSAYSETESIQIWRENIVQQNLKKKKIKYINNNNFSTILWTKYEIHNDITQITTSCNINICFICN